MESMMHENDIRSFIQARLYNKPKSKLNQRQSLIFLLVVHDIGCSFQACAESLGSSSIEVGVEICCLRLAHICNL